MDPKEEWRGAWATRKMQAWRLDPGVARFWAIVLAVVMGVAITAIMAMMVVAKLRGLINVDFVNVVAHNRDVTRDRMVLSIIGGVVVAGRRSGSADITGFGLSPANVSS